MTNTENVHRLIKQNSKLLNLLRFYKGIDRSELSRRLQLSMPTIYNALDELHKFNIVVKSKNEVSINNEYGLLIGISIGSSLCKISFVDLNFQMFSAESFSVHKKNLCKQLESILTKKDLLYKCQTEHMRNYVYFDTPDTFQELKSILNSIFEYVQSCLVNNIFSPLCIGISCTGIINIQTQTILNAHNLTYLDNSTLDSLIFPDKRAFFEKNEIYVSLVQNSNASVIAEKIYLNQTGSVYKDKKNVIALYLGVGIGAGMYLNSLYFGTNGYAGELSHTKAPVYENEQTIKNCTELIERNLLDPSCTCGKNDCYDYKIRTYVFEKNKKEFCDMSADDIRDFLSCHSDKAELFGKYLGNLVNTLTNFLNIDLIIFTGKFYKSMDLLSNSIVSIQDENPLKFSRNDSTILTSPFGSLAPSIGAAIYSYHQKYDLELSWNY
jgi:predicted NBD/HSP70 family sugar kinase